MRKGLWYLSFLKWGVHRAVVVKDYNTHNAVELISFFIVLLLVPCATNRGRKGVVSNDAAEIAFKIQTLICAIVNSIIM